MQIQNILANRINNINFRNNIQHENNIKPMNTNPAIDTVDLGRVKAEHIKQSKEKVTSVRQNSEQILSKSKDIFTQAKDVANNYTVRANDYLNNKHNTFDDVYQYDKDQYVLIDDDNFSQTRAYCDSKGQVSTIIHKENSTVIRMELENNQITSIQEGYEEDSDGTVRINSRYDFVNGNLDSFTDGYEFKPENHYQYREYYSFDENHINEYRENHREYNEDGFATWDTSIDYAQDRNTISTGIKKYEGEDYNYQTSIIFPKNNFQSIEYMKGVVLDENGKEKSIEEHTFVNRRFRRLLKNN